jgi:SAM-dependent methyltransferase
MTVVGRPEATDHRADHFVDKSDGPNRRLFLAGLKEKDVTNVLADQVWAILICPSCGNTLSRARAGAACPACRESYPALNGGQLDLRLRRAKTFPFSFQLGTDLAQELSYDYGVLRRNPSPEVDFTGFKPPWHLTAELMSYFPKAIGAQDLALDVGCGDTLHQEVCEHAGFGYVGIDYQNPDAPILADGHALPFADESFQFVVSINVLEHLKYPFVVVKEIYRVLRSGGKFLGSVAFLEPFHGNSFYHHTHLGVFNSLRTAGFSVEFISPNTAWPALVALASMRPGLFPRLPDTLARSLVFPLQSLHRAWWKLAYLLTRSDQASEKRRVLSMAGSFFFFAVKREEDSRR